MLNSFLLNEVTPNVIVPASYRHYCSDGSYRNLSKNVNHSFIIARNFNEDFVFGQDKDYIELGLVGERLDFNLLPALETQEEADTAAEARQVEARLDTRKAKLILPPDCGIELWDVIRIYDNTCDRDGTDFRVSAAGLTWHSATQQYRQILFLCAV